MSQLSLFNDEYSETLIPENVISPLECTKSVKSVAFRKGQERWRKYVKAIQDANNCSWFEARELLVKHRNNQMPIRISLVVIEEV